MQDTEINVSEENSGSEPMIIAQNLVKIYKTRDIEVLALQGLDLTVERGELMAVIGNSGSGKSTFLNMLGGLDIPSAGKLFVDGRNLFEMTARQKEIYKRQTVGFVWQNNARNLFPYLSAIENVMTPMLLTKEKKRRERAEELLDIVGMSHRKNSRLGELSGGEQQRVAIAIALANNPKLLLADEPTGSVDKDTADRIFDIFRKLSNEMGVTVVIVTHDVRLSKKVNRVVAIRDGRISSERILREQYKDVFSADNISWGNEETQDEYVILDRAGRLQIPEKLLKKLELKDNKVTVGFEEGVLTIRNPKSAEEEKEQDIAE
ncbi:MAG: ABC transporter ATP-binding protein [Lachnospiraceae bacterium]|nr:ABC transporter ATP-binding protein [Lachnospiraceae bacterium]